jgi:hypothetical protein
VTELNDAQNFDPMTPVSGDALDALYLLVDPVGGDPCAPGTVGTSNHVPQTFGTSDHPTTEAGARDEAPTPGRRGVAAGDGLPKDQAVVDFEEDVGGGTDDPDDRDIPGLPDWFPLLIDPLAYVEDNELPAGLNTLQRVFVSHALQGMAQRGLTQKELAEMTGKSVSHVCNMMKRGDGSVSTWNDVFTALHGTTDF